MGCQQSSLAVRQFSAVRVKPTECKKLSSLVSQSTKPLARIYALGAQAEHPHVQDGAPAGRARCKNHMLQGPPMRLALRRRSLALQQHAGYKY